jgi:glutathionyl-hydroquinone reductase
MNWQVPETFLLDVQPSLDACREVLPGMHGYPHIKAGSEVPSTLMLNIAMRLLLDTLPMVGDLSPEAKRERILSVVNSYACADLGAYQYAFAEDTMLALYQWYFHTYLAMFAELEHFFPKFYLQEDGLQYTVKLYGALLRFDRIPSSRDYLYAWDRTT